MAETRVLRSFASLAEYEAAGGGTGLDAAGRLSPTGVVEHLMASGLRGRGGAGFPTGRKWDAVVRHDSPVMPATVVVNAAEGEPGSFKDRAILRGNAYAVLEGALIAATAVGADQVVVATKDSFTREIPIVQRVMDELIRAGWADGVDLAVFAGPEEYLYGEETALLEAIDGRPPFPRVAPPYRHGIDEIHPAGTTAPSQVVMADTSRDSAAPPTLVDNVETMANVPGILAHGPAWFREVGTDASPGTLVCTVTGCTAHAGVGEVAMGTPLRAVLDELGGGARSGHRIVAVMSGVANPLLVEEQLDTPVSYEAMERRGQRTRRGQLHRVRRDDRLRGRRPRRLPLSRRRVLRAVHALQAGRPRPRSAARRRTVLDRDRTRPRRDHRSPAYRRRQCAVLARDPAPTCGRQHRESLRDPARAHVDGGAGPSERVLIVPVHDLEGAVVTFDERQADKQPDWTYDAVDSGKAPAERIHTQHFEAAELDAPL